MNTPAPAASLTTGPRPPCAVVMGVSGTGETTTDMLASLVDSQLAALEPRQPSERGATLAADSKKRGNR
ncbi:hypothetical protein IFM12275_24120 [Nocardia sputorum]|nr:hypothetical protein IFM12275_24120 [Nocardia sputorum]